MGKKLICIIVAVIVAALVITLTMVYTSGGTNMFTYTVNGQPTSGKPMLLGVIIGASTDENRFLAMKQLFDIGMEKLTNPSYTPSDTEFTYADKGIVCVMPPYNPAFYENHMPQVLYSKNADVQGILASTTKVMSLVVGVPYIDNMKEPVTIQQSDIVAGSGNYFSAGDILTLEDLIYGILLPSSNTCATAFARHIGAKMLGDNSASASDCNAAFITEMNRQASILGCTQANFASPSGASINDMASVSDMMRILVEACSYNEILRVWNKKNYDITIKGANPRTQHVDTTVQNATFEASYYIFGGKTGSGSYEGGVTSRALVMVAEPI